MLFGMVTRHLHRLPDLLHAAVPRPRLRRHRPRLGTDLQPRLPADLGHDEGRDLPRRAAVHLHGLHDRAGRLDGAAVRGAAQPAGAGARLALPGGHPDRDDLRHGDRHRRRGGDRARHHGRADDDQGRLRRAAVGGRDRGRRHARHPDSAQRHAGGDGADHGRAGEPALFGRLRPRLPARRHATSSTRWSAASSIRSSARRCRWRSARKPTMR